MSTINVRWHTEGRRQPTLIGKDAAGRKIPGGPYIVWQLLALPVAPSMWSTRPVWAGGLSGLATLVVIAAFTGGLFYLIGRVDFAGRNPLLAGAAAAVAVILAMTACTGRLGATEVRSSSSRRSRRRRRPTQAWHTHTAADKPPVDPATSGSVQPSSSFAGFRKPLPPEHVSTRPSHPVVVSEDQPPRLSPLEAFLAAAGKVSS